MSENEIYLLIKYIKSVLWRVAKRLSYTEDARCLKVKEGADRECGVAEGQGGTLFTADLGTLHTRRQSIITR